MQPLRDPRQRTGYKRLWQKIAKAVSIIAYLPMIEYRTVKSSMYQLMSGAIVAIVKAKRSNFRMCHGDENRYGIFNLLHSWGYLCKCPLFFYCHNGSLSQPWGNPIATTSISGKFTRSASIFAFISFWGDILSKKYLMMQRLKYIRSASVGREIHLPVIRFGIIGLIVFCLFHTRAWWQQEFRVKATIVSHDSKGATWRPNFWAIRFFIRGTFILL